MSNKPKPHYDVPPRAWGPDLGRRALHSSGSAATPLGVLDRLYLFALAHNADLLVTHLAVAFDAGLPNLAFEREGLTRL